MSRPRFADGDAVRLIRTVRDDGTYPGADRGDVLIRRGHVGYVCDIGTFLQDQIIYSVHFLEAGGRVIGCREAELIPADAPWNPSRFERGDRVRTRLALGIRGQVLVAADTQGMVLKALRDTPGDVQYQVQFDTRLLQVPESALEEWVALEEEVSACCLPLPAPPQGKTSEAKTP